MYLLFFISRLRVEGRSRTPLIYLRYKAATDGYEGVDFNEQLLNAFCFPLGPEAVQPKEVQASEEYTFTLTHNDGQRFTGFCRQIFPPAPRVGSKARYPQVLCIVAENPWCNFFFKVLQVAEQILKGYEGLLDSTHRELPLDSQLGSFLVDLRKQLATNPAPGEVLRLQVPNLHALQGVSPPRYMGAASSGEALNWTEDRIELQVPPDCGDGQSNTGIPLARLLFHVPVEGMLTLIASLLLERRIVFVARSRDTVTAAVQAAQALIYPFRWQHIYLPLLPRDLVDYLSAPMPFLVGLTSDMLPLIRHIPMSEVTTVDLDLQKVFAPPGAQYDDSRALPYGRQLGAALEAVFRTVRSPTEYESSPLITGVMQEYFVRLFGSYRRFIHDQAMEPLLRALPTITSAASGTLTSRGGARESARGGRDRDRDRDTRESRGGVSAFAPGGDCAPSPQSSHRLHDEMLRGHGYYFDQPAFVAHRRSETVRSFLNAMRHSQLYQMFIQERLQMAANGAIELPASSNQSFSFASAIGGGRARSILAKSSSANNLTAFDKAGSHAGAGTVHGHGHETSSSSDALRERAATNSGASGRDKDPPSRGLPAGSSSSAQPTQTGMGGPSTSDPFELRVSRYPEQRRLRREQLRSMAAEMPPMGSSGGSKLGSKLRRHRRTDSEDLHSQAHAFGSLHGGESMRRITTYPGVLDLSVASVNDPASYFVEWDFQEDDGDDESISPSPSPRDRDHMRSESGNSLYSAESNEPPGPSSVAGAAAAAAAAGGGGAAAGAAAGSAAGAAASRPGERTAREGGGRDLTPLRRLSVPMLASNAKSTYTSLRGMPSNESPMAADRPATTVAATAGPAPPPPAASTGGAGTRVAAAVHHIFGANGSASEAGTSGTFVRGGVQVKMLPDGHRVYDGTIKDMMRLAATEAKNGLLSGLHGLTSPLSSPRGLGKEKEGAVDRRARAPQQQPQQSQPQLQQQQRQLLPAFTAASPPHHLAPCQQLQHSSALGNPTHLPHGPSPLALSSSPPPPSTVPLPGMGPGAGEAASTSAGAAAGAGSSSSRPPSLSTPSAGVTIRPEDPQQHSRLTSIFSNLKDRVAGAGTKALGILPTPTYKPQTTGEKAAKFKAQLTGGGGASLLAGADGKLKQPHAPQRPLSLSGMALMGHQQQPWMRSDHSDSSIIHPPPPTPLYGTPMASPAAPGTPANATAPVEVSPFAPRVQGRLPSNSGVGLSSSRVPGPQLLASGDFTPPAGISAAGGSTSGPFWQETSTHPPPPTDWDPFGTASAPPAVGGALAPSPFGGAASAAAAIGNGPAASKTLSPFAATATATPPQPFASAVACSAAAAAATAGSSSCGAVTADLLGMTQSAPSAGSSSFAAPLGGASSSLTFDPFVASEHHPAQGKLESAGSNDFAAFASASSPGSIRDFPGLPVASGGTGAGAPSGTFWQDNTASLVG